MGPEWWVDAAEQAEDQHDPEAYGGREWEELTDAEVSEAVADVLGATADYLRETGELPKAPSSQEARDAT